MVKKIGDPCADLSDIIIAGAFGGIKGNFIGLTLRHGKSAYGHFRNHLNGKKSYKHIYRPGHTEYRSSKKSAKKDAKKSAKSLSSYAIVEGSEYFTGKTFNKFDCGCR